jgi:ribosome-binding protein aMBF1 (putative translation factor)
MAIPAQDGYVAAMTPAQCRAARGLLNWSEDRLASSAGIKVSVVREFEDEKSVPRMTAQALQRAFEAAGIEFSDHGAPGVRQQPAPAVLRVDELNASNDD